MIFENRTIAGRILGERLQFLAAREPLIFALPRGGVPVAYEISKSFRAPLEVLVVKKIGAPFNREYGIGAATEGGYSWVNPETVRALGLTPDEIQSLVRQELAEVNRRIEVYRGNRKLPSLEGKTAIIVDDGLATGVTARVACQYIKSHGAQSVILAMPVCAADTADEIRRSDPSVELICLQEPQRFYAVGQFYQDFNQISDEEVVSLLVPRKSA